MLSLLINAYCFGQTIGDNKVQFQYTQLPLIKLDEGFNNYEVRVEHGYALSNEDSLRIYAMNIKSAQEIYEMQLKRYWASKDSLKRRYLLRMADYQKKQNAGLAVVNGVAIPKPNPPVMPIPPVLAQINAPFLHAVLTDDIVDSRMKITGLEKGVGGCILNVNIGAIQNISFKMKKSGSGTNTKYVYSANYSLPVKVKFDSPSQGSLMNKDYGNNVKSTKIKEFKSQYEFDIYLMDNKEKIYRDIELKARQEIMSAIVASLNDKFGYLNKTRKAEIYHVKRFKNYEYSDADEAYKLTLSALNKVKDSRDLTASEESIDEALSAWYTIMEEHTDFDKSARVNKKLGQ